MADPKLTTKQEMFCKEYLIDLNATQASIRAGYSVKTSYSIGNENLSKPDIQQRIQELMQERSQRVEYDADWVLKEAAKSYTYNTKPIYDSQGNEIMRNAPAASKFLDMVGKHTSVKAFEKEVEVNNTINVTETLSEKLTGGSKR